MSRFFDGGVQRDFITFTPGNGPGQQGGITIAVLARASQTNFTGWLVNGVDSGGFAKWGLLSAAANPGRLYMENDFGNGGPVVGTNWCWLVATKGVGNVQPDFYRYDFDADTWEHSQGSATVPDLNGTTATILLGAHTGGSAGDSWRGWMAAAAAWKHTLTFTQIQAALTRSAKDLFNAGPDWGVLLNQSSTSTTVHDFTGNLGNQTAITGTTVDSEVEPPGWSYTLPDTIYSEAHRALASAFVDGIGITIATTFRPLVDGFVLGGRQLLLGDPGIGQYQLALWEITGEDAGAATGTLLATADYNTAIMSAVAWNWVSFSSPVPVLASKFYRIGIRTSEGRYSAVSRFYDTGPGISGVTSGNLYAPHTLEFFEGYGSYFNGSYVESVTEYPFKTFNGNAYFVDPGFVVAAAAPSGPTLKVWNGTTEVPASLKIWNGSAEVSATVSIT